MTTTTDVLEGSPITLKTGAKGKFRKSYQAKLVVLLDGVPMDELSKEFEVGSALVGSTKVEHTFEAPAPDASDELQESCELSYRLEAGDKVKATGSQVFRVWPSTVKIKATNPKDGDKAFSGLHFMVSQGSGPGSLLVTGSEGTAEGPLRPGPFTVEVTGPYDVKETVRKGRSFEFKVEPRPYKVKIDAPLNPGEGKQIRQFVTLDTKEPNRPGVDGLGREVKVALRTGGGVADKGKEIFYQVEFEHKTLRVEDEEAAKRGVKPAADKVELNYDGASDEDKKKDRFSGKLVLDPEGFAYLTLCLGVAGGDLCRLSVGAVKDKWDEVLEFENWRRLWFQATSNPTYTKPDLGALTRAFAAVKIDLIERDEVKVQATDLPAGALIPAGEILSGASGDYLVIGTHNEEEIHRAVHSAHAADTYSSSILFCDYQFDAGSSSTTEITVAGAHCEDRGGARWVTYTMKQVFPTTGAAALPTNLRDGTAALSGVSVKVDGTRSAVAPGDCKVDYAQYSANRGAVSIKLPAGTDPDTQTVKVKFTLKSALGPYLGSATKNLILIAGLGTRDGVPFSGSNISSTLIHELGHAMGMTPSAVTLARLPGIADPRAVHSKWYIGGAGNVAREPDPKPIDRGHQGNHCAEGFLRRSTRLPSRATCPARAGPAPCSGRAPPRSGPSSALTARESCSR